MPRMVGIHLLNNPDPERIVPLIKKLQPRVIKALVLAGSGSYLADLADLLKGELDYEPTYVLRVWWDDANAGRPDNFSTLQNTATLHEQNEWHYNPNIAWQAWRAAVRVDLEAIQGRDNFYIESFNEVGISREYLQFERERTVYTRLEYGVRSLVVNMGVGWSELSHFELMRDVGLFFALRDYGGAFGEHAYGSVLGMALWHGPEMQAVNPEGLLNVEPQDVADYDTVWPDNVASWLAFRPSMSHQNMILTGAGDIPIIVSEFGIDDAGFNSYRHYTDGRAAGAWRECIPIWRDLGYLDDRTPEQFYGEQLAYAEEQMRVYAPWLIGATVFTVGSDPASRWALYDVLDTPVFDEFLLAVDDEPAPPPPPPPPPPPDTTGCIPAVSQFIAMLAAYWNRRPPPLD